MIKMLVPWRDVAPWAMVVDPANAAVVWTVQPFYPTAVKLLSDGRITRYLTPRPLDLVTVLVPDTAEALATLLSVFRGAELLGTDISAPGQPEFWLIPARDGSTHHAHWLGDHMRQWHDIVNPSYWRLPLFEFERFHLACHQQSTAYPIAKPHTHQEWYR